MSIVYFWASSTWEPATLRSLSPLPGKVKQNLLKRYNIKAHKSTQEQLVDIMMSKERWTYQYTADLSHLITYK